MSARYLEISSPMGLVDPANAIDIPAGAPPLRYRAEHLAWLRGTSGALDDACAALRVVVRRVALRAEEAEACDRAWRHASQPWRLASAHGDVRDPDAGLASSTIGGVR